MQPAQLLALDAAHIWHPYSPMPATVESFLVASARGTRLRLGRPVAGHDELIDGMSSWWAAIHGYRHPVLDAALREQIDRVSHVMLGGLTHAPVIELGQALVEVTPGDLQHVFFTDSGSVAVEVAVKMCLQYWRARGRPEKLRLLTWSGGYHGDTFETMSICDPVGGMHQSWAGVLRDQFFVPQPPPGFDAPVDDGYVAALERIVEQHRDEIAAIVVEPVVQGAGGMQFHNPGYLQALREIADRHDVLLVFDEIATGFGRTGAFFAAELAAVAPDVMCVGKALTGGYLPMAATLCTPRVAARIAAGSPPVLQHGPTFMGNPLAAAVAGASLQLLRTSPWRATLAAMSARLSTALAPARQLPGVADVRVLGGIGVVELDHPVDVEKATLAAAAGGVWLRPFRNLVYAMPPYICTPAEIDAIGAAIVHAAAA